MEQARQFVDMVASDQMVDAKNVMDEMLSSQAFAKMEDIKQYIASTMFGTPGTEAE